MKESWKVFRLRDNDSNQPDGLFVLECTSDHNHETEEGANTEAENYIDKHGGELVILKTFKKDWSRGISQRR